MDEEPGQYTAFTVGSMGVYEFLHMPYGLCNAPTTFQHLMQNCLGELNLMYALIYLDDVIVYSKTEDEHLVHLRAVLERFMENGLKLKPSKCNFFRTEINYLGHKVSVAGMEPGTERSERHRGDHTPCYVHPGAQVLRHHGILPSFHQRIRQDCQAVERPTPGGEQQA